MLLHYFIMVAINAILSGTKHDTEYIELSLP